MQEETAMKNLKVLMLNGSPRPNGNTAVALREMETVFRENGVETELVSGRHTLRLRIAKGERTGCQIRNFVVNQ